VIVPVDPSALPAGFGNLAGPPELTYGVRSEPDGTENTLEMRWDPIDSEQESAAGWGLVWGQDPDIRNTQISLSINPPGGFWPNPLPPPPNLFVGIMNVAVVAVDIGGLIAGGWGFNTDMRGLAGAPANDMFAAGLISLQNNFMHNVLINVGNGPLAQSATVTPLGGAPFPGPFIAPNFVVPGAAGNLGFGQIGSLWFFENGILRGATGIPGMGIPGLVNYWDHLIITRIPEPTTVVLLGLGGLLLMAFGWRKRSRA